MVINQSPKDIFSSDDNDHKADGRIETQFTDNDFNNEDPSASYMKITTSMGVKYYAQNAGYFEPAIETFKIYVIMASNKGATQNLTKVVTEDPININVTLGLADTLKTYN